MSEAESDMEKGLEETVEKLMKSMIVNDKNVIMHTEIQKPLHQMALELYGKRLKDLNLDLPSKLIDYAIEHLNTNMVSFKRQRSIEEFGAISEFFKSRRRTIEEKLIGAGKE
jgi:hypothetical protein